MRAWLRTIVAVLLVIATPVAAADLRARLTPALIQQVFPGAEEVGAQEGTPPALPVKIGGEIAGYIFSTKDTVEATGYGGTPFDLVGGMTLDGKITGAALLEDHESILDRGVGRATMETFVAGFAAAKLNDWRAVKPDQVKGATTSARMMKSGMQAAARVVASDQLPPATADGPALDRNRVEVATVADLLERGAIVRRTVAMRDVIQAFVASAGTGAVPQHLRDDPNAAFLDVKVALLTPPAIGANILGLQRFNEAMDRQGDGRLTLWIASTGTFPFGGTGRNQLASGFFEDTVSIVQGDKVIRLRASMLRSIRATGGENPLDDDDAGLVFLPADSGLDPLQPWQLVFAVPGRNAAGAAVTVTQRISYTLPQRYIAQPPPPPPPAWVEAWTQHRVDIALLLALLAAVTAVFLGQDVLTRRPRAYAAVRVVLLSVTLGWLGWYAGGQLSIVNILAYLQAPFTRTPLGTLLLDPLVVILMAYVAITLLVLGRGVYCGWLCPFGALQELTNKIAVRLHVPQWHMPPLLHERLWAVKYLVAAAIAGLAFGAVQWSNSVAEVEPFKTAISVRFARDLPYVLYAGGLLAIGLFVERFYCRFLCPLGGALAVLGRVRMVRWLKRRPQCGSECRICETACPVGAITPIGAINMNECLQCLDCQVAYHDPGTCPPLKARAQRREARKTAISGQLPVSTA